MLSYRRHLLGMLTPSSNTVLEPAIADMLHGVAGVSAHFGRFAVTQISLDEAALRQFDTASMLAAARLLADARVQSICWNGTSAGWLGFDRDIDLCREITAATGIAACSSVLALNEIFARTGVRRFALVSPYLDEVQDGIAATYRAAGLECVAERHLGLRDNFSFSEVSAADLAEMCRAVAHEAAPDAVAIFCTNLDGARIAAAMEAELGIPVYDTVATALWKSLLIAGVDPACVQGWGGLFQRLA